MRMWMVNPKILCQKHLFGEHVELHMFIGTLKRNISISGYIKNNLLEILSIEQRHSELSMEIMNRKYKHNSPLIITPEIYSYLSINEINYKIDKDNALYDLISRCPFCNENYINLVKGIQNE